MKRKFGINEICYAENIQVGDVVELPEFTVQETTIGGDTPMHFDTVVVKDTATVYDIKDGKLYLVFDHGLFESAIDNNNEKEWKNTQLCKYLELSFLPAMEKARIPASEISLLSKDELSGDNQFPFFRNGKNRIAFAKDEDHTIWYWLKTPYKEASSARFCVASDNGYSYYHGASGAVTFVRPRFVIDIK